MKKYKRNKTVAGMDTARVAIEFIVAVHVSRPDPHAVTLTPLTPCEDSGLSVRLSIDKNEFLECFTSF